MTEPDEISDEMANMLLSSVTQRGPKADPTEPRIAVVWFKLVVSLTDTCENPSCQDPRPVGDRGRNVTALVKGKRMCRYCFLSGWLSDGS